MISATNTIQILLKKYQNYEIKQNIKNIINSTNLYYDKLRQVIKQLQTLNLSKGPVSIRRRQTYGLMSGRDRIIDYYMQRKANSLSSPTVIPNLAVARFND